MAKSGPKQGGNFLYVYWPVLFAMGTMLLMFGLQPTPGCVPVSFDFSGKQTKRVLMSPWFLGTTIPIILGLIWLHYVVRREGIKAQEHRSMVWWLTNLLWFHTGCDLLSGFWQVMPILTEFYALMTPAHNMPRWHESRAHLDAVYVLELIVEVPMAAWALKLFVQRDPARHIVEVFAASAQLAGTVAYYAPGLVKFEAACWLSWVDRSCGFVWIAFPLLLLSGHLQAAREGKMQNGKAKNKKS